MVSPKVYNDFFWCEFVFVYKCVYGKSFQTAKVWAYSNVYILIGEDNLPYSFYLHSEVSIFKSEV